jgi:hypothetical protein
MSALRQAGNGIMNKVFLSVGDRQKKEKQMSVQVINEKMMQNKVVLDLKQERIRMNELKQNDI